MKMKRFLGRHVYDTYTLTKKLLDIFILKGEIIRLKAPSLEFRPNMLMEDCPI